MNAIDLPIVATVVLLALFGLKTGLLRPISGIGGMIVAVFIAVQSSGDLAAALEQSIEGDTVRRITAFVAIVIISVIVSRIAAFLIKRVLKMLALGWLDHVAGAVAGAALGIVVAGTSIYLLTGANIESTQDALAASRLAPEVARATLVSSSKPWCWQVEDTGPSCTDIMGLFDEYLGRHISDTVGNFLGDDGGAIVNVVQNRLKESPQDLVSLVNVPVEEDRIASIAAETANGLANGLDTSD